MQPHIGCCAERKVALECAPDGFPDRINPKSTRTVTPLRFRSPSEVLAKFWQNSCGPYERADKAVLWVWLVSPGRRKARSGARRKSGPAVPKGCRNAACAGRERRTVGRQRRPDEAGLARRLCGGRKSQQEHLPPTESIRRVGRRAGIH